MLFPEGRDVPYKDEYEDKEKQEKQEKELKVHKIADWGTPARGSTGPDTGTSPRWPYVINNKSTIASQCKAHT